jgi:hypothetical protein
MNTEIRPDLNAYFRPVSLVIIISFVGFFVLAFALLYPVYRLLKREEEKNQKMD